MSIIRMRCDVLQSPHRKNWLWSAVSCCPHVHCGKLNIGEAGAAQLEAATSAHDGFILRDQDDDHDS